MKLAESTIERKGLSKALIDTGFLVNAIIQKIMANKAVVGLLRGVVNKDGEYMVNIGAVLECGAPIKHPNGAAIIPARSSRTIARRSAPRFEPPTHRQCFR
ncbi:hypothetical protein [Desulfobacter hydrogenophilus]|uniref:hypothetical protein n=1 Tax=Desulfobacter hydrogenophilus TaxID=2291 RepID=UPI001F5E50E7|nr:hypothetical protein [Desulfobacter hydrogenophilus]